MARVLLVGKGPPERGGIPTFIATLLQVAPDTGHALDFLNLTPQGERQGGRASLTNARRTARDFARVLAAARGYDIVHVHSAMAPAVTALRAGALATAGRLRGCRVVVHVHGGLVAAWLRGRRRRAMMRAALAPAHRVLAVSSGGVESLQGLVPAGRLALLDNAVAVPATGDRRSRTEPGAVPCILYVGTLTPRKGVLDLLAASALLHDRGVAHEVVLVGGTPDEGSAAEAEVRAAAGDRALLLGPRPAAEMANAYAGADLLCLPSWWEAMPLSVLEAMAAGLPVVATDVGDVARVVQHGETGLVVPPRRPDLLADALADLLQDPGRRHAMGEAGHRRVAASFSLDRLCQDVSRLYSGLVGDAGPADRVPA